MTFSNLYLIKHCIHVSHTGHLLFPESITYTTYMVTEICSWYLLYFQVIPQILCTDIECHPFFFWIAWVVCTMTWDVPTVIIC